MTDRSPLTADQQAELDLLHALADREAFLIGIIHDLQARERDLEAWLEAAKAYALIVDSCAWEGDWDFAFDYVIHHMREVRAATSSPVESPP